MKLISKYNRVNILATIAVLVAGSICYYFIVRYALIRQLDNALKVEEAEIKDYARMHQQLPQATSYRDQQIAWVLADHPVKRRFSNITIHDPRDQDNDPYRMLQFPIEVGGHYYTVNVTKSEVETEYLVGLIVLITVGVIGLLLLFLFMANRLLLRNTWKAFYDSLQSIREFNLSGKQYVPVRSSDIDEFRDLDQALSVMTAKIVKDYETLKNFADNASHEMQTPLAIINSKLDLLIQGRELDENQVKQLQAIYDGVGRLTKLNQSLLLLTKIENNQFTEVAPVALHRLIEEKLIQLDDIIRARQLSIQTSLNHVILPLNEYLTDILLNNLILNAIRHNIRGGWLRIDLRPDALAISNTGPAFSFDASRIFERFKKGDQSEGAGLGLAIVKQICDLYHFQISYQPGEGTHQFTVRF